MDDCNYSIQCIAHFTNYACKVRARAMAAGTVNRKDKSELQGMCVSQIYPGLGLRGSGGCSKGILGRP